MSQKQTVILMLDNSSENTLDAGRHVELRARFLDPEQSGREDGPRDCVLSSPSVTPEATQLIAFDDDGRPRAILILPTEIVSQEDERWLLDRIRASRPKRDTGTLRLIG